MRKLKNNLKAGPDSSESGFITMIICIVLILTVIIGFAYLKVMNANK